MWSDAHQPGERTHHPLAVPYPNDHHHQQATQFPLGGRRKPSSPPSPGHQRSLNGYPPTRAEKLLAVAPSGNINPAPAKLFINKVLEAEKDWRPHIHTRAEQQATELADAHTRVPGLRPTRSRWSAARHGARQGTGASESATTYRHPRRLRVPSRQPMKERLHVLAVGGLLSRDVLNQISASDQALIGANPTDYGLVQGERIGDAAARSWNRLVGIWANFRQAESRLPKTDRTATTLTRDRWLKPLLEELGFVGIPRVQTLTIDEKDYPISHEWGGSVPVHQLGWRLLVDKRSPGITGAAKTSPHSLLQEFLNRSDQHLWGFVTNGAGAPTPARQRHPHPSGLLRIRPASHLRRQRLQRLPNTLANLPPHPLRRQSTRQLLPRKVEPRSDHRRHPSAGPTKRRSRERSSAVGKRVPLSPRQYPTTGKHPQR